MMLTRNQVHQMIDDLPETDLQVLARMLQGLQSSPELTALPAEVASRPVSPIKPVGKTPLAKQYSQVMRRDETPESNDNLLRKVMFTPLSDLLSWVNQPAASNSPPDSR